MSRRISLDDLWDSSRPGERVFRPDQLAALPEAARRYLEHAIAPETRLASAVRLRMHGEIKLRRWFPFTAEQVISRAHGMLWTSTVRMSGITLFRGFDRVINSEGAMLWNLFGFIPFITASGSNINRSAAGRVIAESVWLPAMLCEDNVSWTAQDSFHPHALLTLQGERGELALTIDGEGRLQSLKMRRWGNPDGKAFRYEDFGGAVTAERTFDGYTIPSRLRVGWYFGTERFAKDGEFFRVTIDDATYR